MKIGTDLSEALMSWRAVQKEKKEREVAAKHEQEVAALLGPDESEEDHTGAFRSLCIFAFIRRVGGYTPRVIQKWSICDAQK